MSDYEREKMMSIKASYGMSSSNADMPSRESAMERELAALSRSGQDLLQQCEVLEHRLAGILQAQPKSIDNGETEEMLSPIPNEIRKNRRMIDNADYILKSILSRLEI